MFSGVGWEAAIASSTKEKSSQPIETATLLGWTRLQSCVAEMRDAGELSSGARGSKVKGARVDEKPALESQGVDRHHAAKEGKRKSLGSAPAPS